MHMYTYIQFKLFRAILLDFRLFWKNIYSVKIVVRMKNTIYTSLLCFLEKLSLFRKTRSSDEQVLFTKLSEHKCFWHFYNAIKSAKSIQIQRIIPNLITHSVKTKNVIGQKSGFPVFCINYCVCQYGYSGDVLLFRRCAESASGAVSLIAPIVRRLCASQSWCLRCSHLCPHTQMVTQRQ